MKAQTLSPEVLKTSSMPSASWGLFFRLETPIALRTAFHESPLKMKRFAFYDLGRQSVRSPAESV